MHRFVYVLCPIQPPLTHHHTVIPYRTLTTIHIALHMGNPGGMNTPLPGSMPGSRAHTPGTHTPGIGTSNSGSMPGSMPGSKPGSRAQSPAINSRFPGSMPGSRAHTPGIGGGGLGLGGLGGLGIGGIGSTPGSRAHTPGGGGMTNRGGLTSRGMDENPYRDPLLQVSACLIYLMKWAFSQGG